MDIDLLISKIHRKLVYKLAPRLVPGQVRTLQKINETSRERVVAEGGPVVSLTTYGPRIDTVHLTIESIGRGRLKPSRLTLWLDDAKRFNDLPAGLRRLQARGLEVMLTENLGPHTKYYPYVASLAQHTVPLVTADDDIVYPRWWLQRLVAAYRAEPEQINCYRAHVVALGAAAASSGTVAPGAAPASNGAAPGAPAAHGDASAGAAVTVDGTTIRSYRDWPPCSSRAPRWRHFATGVSGVIYPPRILNFMHAQGDAFRACCPKADDIWLHAMALRAGMRVRQIGRLPRYFEGLPGTHDQGLVHFNSFNGGNDRQVAATYDAADLRKMIQEPG